MSCGKDGLHATIIGRRYLSQNAPKTSVVATEEEVQELRDHIFNRVRLRSFAGPIQIYGVPVVNAEGEPYVW